MKRKKQQRYKEPKKPPFFHRLTAPIVHCGFKYDLMELSRWKRFQIVAIRFLHIVTHGSMVCQECGILYYNNGGWSATQGACFSCVMGRMFS